MKIVSATFHVSAPDLESCPAWELDEFAFIGRSNVGKSSLINLLSGRRELAKVSATPGKTRLINFFVINRKWSLVDLPGYGFAKVTGHQRHDFNEAVADYLEGRPNLACVFVLIDSRHPPQKIDVAFLEWLAGLGRPFALVFTKADKQSAAKTRAAVEAFREELGGTLANCREVFLASTKSGDGRLELLGWILDWQAGAAG